MLPERLLDWFHILRTMHIKEELVRNGLPKPERGEVLPHMKLKEVKMPFPSGRSLNVHVQTVLSLRQTLLGPAATVHVREVSTLESQSQRGNQTPESLRQLGVSQSFPSISIILGYIALPHCKFCPRNLFFSFNTYFEIVSPKFAWCYIQHHGML